MRLSPRAYRDKSSERRFSISSSDLFLFLEIFSDTDRNHLLGRHYRITINLARPSTAESWVQGFMKVTLHADKGVIRNMDLTPRQVIVSASVIAAITYIRPRRGPDRAAIESRPV